MKKLFFLSIIFLAGQIGFSQIVLEHSFVENDLESGQGGFPFNTEDGLQFYYLNGSDLNIYKSDYSIYKTLELKPLDGFKNVGIMMISDKLFNLDSKIEFLAIHYSETKYQMNLMDEDGQILKEFGDYMTCFTVEHQGDTKVILRKQNFDSSGKSSLQDDIYDVPGEYYYYKSN